MDSAGALSYYKNIENILGMLTILNLTAYQWSKPVCVPDGAKFDFIVVGGGTAGCLIASRLVERNARVLLIEAGTVPPIESEKDLQILFFPDGAKFDFIVVGGGTAGCLIASRLVERNARVQLIEAGTVIPIESEMPGLFTFMKDSRYDWNFTSTCEGLTTEYHTNNVIHMSQGKVLGGSGSLTYGCYVRGNPHDYNTWADITDDPSWSWKSVQPLFCKNEQLIDKKILESNETHCYGTKGKIKIQKQYYKRNRDFFNALEEIGYEYHLDINPKHSLGFTHLMFNIGDEMRQNTVKKFLSPLKDNKKLHLMLNTLVKKIIFDNNKTAIGVEVLTEDKRKLSLFATKEVIVTAGTIKSPQLLMLSGIGPKFHLHNKSIKVVSDLPVGKNFQDHVNCILIYKMTKSSLASNLRDPHKYPYVIFDGYVALNKSQIYPDYETIGIHFGDSLTFLGLCAFFFSYDEEFCNRLGKGADGKEVFMVIITYFNPESRGEILLQSTNPNDYPLIYTGYYTNDIDITKHASYLADFNRVLNSTYFRKVEAELVDPQMKKCEGLKRGTTEYWRCYTLGTSDTAHYFVDTCAMGTVLDSSLRVRGVKRLRVADASVMPTNVRALTEATVMMIARKASDMIIKEHGLRLKKRKV